MIDISRWGNIIIEEKVASYYEIRATAIYMRVYLSEQYISYIIIICHYTSCIDFLFWILY